MIIESRKFIFRKALVISAGMIGQKEAERLKDKYDKLSIVSYEKLNLTGFTENMRTTALIKLRGMKIDEIFSGFNYETRHKIRRAEKNEVVHVVSLDNDIHSHYSLYVEFEESQGRKAYRKLDLADCLFFGAYSGKELLSSVICQDINGKVLRIKHIASKRLKTDNKKKIRLISEASKFVFYEAIRYAHLKGFEHFDLNGINLKDPAKRGITDFKMGFGGSILDEYWYVYKSPFFRIAEGIFNKFKI